MALADDIQLLTTRTLSALEASHDYYTYTNMIAPCSENAKGW
jgi:hypothetical protein